jgi:hypothetical protein
LLLFVYSDELDSISQEFVNSSRRTYFYDENNEDTAQVWEKWNVQSQQWIAFHKAVLTHNDNGLTVQKLDLDWAADTEEWMNDRKQIIKYNPEGLADTNEHYTWLHNYSMWYPSYRNIFFYDDQDRIIESIRQEDGSGDEIWINESRILQHFNSGKLAEKRTQKWGADNWVDDRIELTNYINDTLIESQTFINYNPYEETYDTSTRWLTIFNAHFIPEKFLMQAYSQETSEFITTSQWIYYFSPMAPQSVNEVEQLEFAIYPNPSSGIFQLTLTEGADHARFTVSGVDGSIVNEGSFESNETHIDLSNKAKGIYFIRVISGNHQGVKKAVKF